MGGLGFLLWLLAAWRLAAYIRWAWQKGYRSGAVGAAVLAVVTLVAILLEEFRLV
ncbi:MAG: hypothetical protein GX493_08260 [Firmicutes bacterium]|nr:hypothetical protein [Bacillota bacterium]